MSERRIGTIDHYYPKAHAAVLHVEKGKVHVGDTVHIRGRNVDLTEKVTSLQIDHAQVDEARKGEDVGIYVEEPVKGKADVFLVDA